DSLWGFFPEAAGAGGDGVMMKLSPGAEKASEAFSDTGYGNYFCDKGRFYGTALLPSDTSEFPENMKDISSDNLKPFVYSVNRDGSDRQLIGQGDLTLLSDDGSCFGITQFIDKGNGDYGYIYSIYKQDSEIIRMEVSGYDMTLVGCTGNHVVIQESDENGNIEFISLTPGNTPDSYERTSLGRLEHEDEESYDYPQFKEFRCEGEKVFISEAVYSGTASMLQTVYLITADASKADSAVVTEGKVNEEDESVSWKFVTEKGNIKQVSGLPGEVVYNGYGTDKKLMYYDENAECHEIKSMDGAPAPFGGRNDGETVYGVTCNVPYGFYHDGRICLVANTCIRTPLTDIGWRESLKIVSTAYESMDVASGKVTLTDRVDYPSALGFVTYAVKDRKDIVVCQQYGTDMEEAWDESSAVEEYGMYAYSYRLSDDLVFENSDGVSGGVDEMMEFLLRDGRKTFTEDMRSDGDSWDLPAGEDGLAGSVTGEYAGEKMRVWFDPEGRIVKAVVDYAG
nr:hypothetical protein [Lachnospiraceae bacterium]